MRLSLLIVFLGVTTQLFAKTSYPAALDEVFSVVIPDEPFDLDPQNDNSTITAQLHTALYEGLVTLDPITLQPIPGLAESWEITSNDCVYTFYLRKNMRFSDGTPIDAYSFYRSFLRLLDRNISKEASYLLEGVKNVCRYRSNQEIGISDLGLSVINPYTFRITLEKPITSFLSILAHHAFVPISSYQLPAMWRDFTHIAYSGPYIVTQISGKEMVLSKNPFYWDKENVAIATIRIRGSNHELQNAKQFTERKIDWLLGPFARKHIKDKTALKASLTFATRFFYFSGQEKAFQDERVREALFLLVPWKELANLSPSPASGLVPPLPSKLGYPAYKGFKTDVHRALKLLKLAGYPQGQGLPELVIATNNIHDTAAKLIASSWLRLKTTVRVHVPDKDYFTYLKTHRPTLTAYAWMADYLDPAAFLELFTSQSTFNKSIFKNAQFDDLLCSANLTKTKQRFRLLANAENLLLNSYVIVPVMHPLSCSLIDIESVHGWYSNPLDLHPFKYLSFSLNNHTRNNTIGKDACYVQP